MGNWRCVTILRGDTVQTGQPTTETTTSGTTSSPVGSFGNSRFTKVGATAGFNAPVWH